MRVSPWEFLGLPPDIRSLCEHGLRSFGPDFDAGSARWPGFWQDIYVSGSGIHRSNGPALKRQWRRAWFTYNVPHRTKGPAVELWHPEHAEPKNYYYVHGVRLPKLSFYKITKGNRPDEIVAELIKYLAEMNWYAIGSRDLEITKKHMHTTMESKNINSDFVDQIWDMTKLLVR